MFHHSLFIYALVLFQFNRYKCGQPMPICHPCQTGWLMSAHHIYVTYELAKIDFAIAKVLFLFSNAYIYLVFFLMFIFDNVFAVVIEQLEEYSLRSHLIQTKQPLERNKHPILASKTFPWP